MTKIFISLSLFLLQLMSSHVVLAETLTPDQVEIKSLIKKMYSIDPDTFEFGKFGGKYKNGHLVVEGKYEPKRQCKLLEEFLVKEAVIKAPKDVICMTGIEGYFRYPDTVSSDMDLSSATRDKLPSKPQINTPSVDGDKAKVHVIFKKENANVMYYLKKQNAGWRIYRVETSRNEATMESFKTHGEGQLDRINIFPPENSFR